MLEALFQYRTLIGKCELGVGLEWEDIALVTELEARFAPADGHRNGRRFRREPCRFVGVLRGDRIHDRVDVVELGLGGLVIRNAPYVARGEQVELTIEQGDLVYRFVARGVWLKDDGDDFRVALQLVGMPVCLHRVAISAHQEDVVDKLKLAA